MENKLPLVSIITPSYNQSEFIENTIRSAKNKNYPNIEHIIIDGGSQDETISLLKKYEKTYNMKWISESDSGQSDAINKGFKLAQGEIIGWVNSDDVYVFRDTISTVVNVLIQNPDINIVYGDCIIIDERNVIKRIYNSPDWNYNYLLKGFSYIPQPATFFRKKVIFNSELNTTLNFAMDIDLWLRLGKNYPFYHINKILAGDRFHAKAKRFCKENITKFQQESKAIRKAQGVDINIDYWIKHYLIILYISTFRRLIGIKKILKLEYDEDTFAVELKTENKILRIWHQLFPHLEITSLISIMREK